MHGCVWLSHSQRLDGGKSRWVPIHVSIACLTDMHWLHASCIARVWLRRNGHFERMSSAWLRRESCIAWDRPQPSTSQPNARTAACTELETQTCSNTMLVKAMACEDAGTTNGPKQLVGHHIPQKSAYSSIHIPRAFPRVYYFFSWQIL